LRFPFIVSAKISFPELWYITESNGDVTHYRLFEISIMQKNEQKALQLILGWVAVAVAWVGFSESIINRKGVQ
jgi:hypothetical protein